MARKVLLRFGRDWCFSKITASIWSGGYGVTGIGRRARSTPSIGLRDEAPLQMGFYSGFMCASLITFPHFSVSALM